MRRIPGYSLWLGHAGDVRDVRVLLATGIVAVVDLASHEPPATMTREVVYCRFPVVDGPGNPPWLLRAAVEALAGLLRDEVPTLLGCGAGLSRSPCIAGAAIARIRGCPADEGLAIALGTAPTDVSPGLWADVRQVVTQSTQRDGSPGASHQEGITDGRPLPDDL